MNKPENEPENQAEDAVIVTLGEERLAVFSVPLEVRTQTPLTAAEREVAQLACSGLSNKEIAARRGTSVRTVANQFQSIFQKLGVASRAELIVCLGET